MALEKVEAVDKVIVRSPFNQIEIRTALIVKEDNAVIARRYGSVKLQCGKLDEDDNLVDTDVSSYSAEIQGIAAAVWTDSTKAAYKTALIAAKE